MFELKEKNALEKIKEQINQTNHPSLDKDDSIIYIINELLIDAFDKKVSDLHFESFEKKIRIRYRIDGHLNEILTVDKKLGLRLLLRLKIMANLDIAEKRLPQDGRFQFSFEKQKSKKTVDIRLSVCPVLYGEKIVLRLLRPLNNEFLIDELGMSQRQKNAYLTALNKSDGMILVVGPTGSGKTMTLYSGLNYINTIHKNISTVEDPIEIHLNGINQVNIHEKIGLGFSKVLKSFLRQDPDVLMVGEMRDFETADIAIKAAQTGHLVLSTLHSKSAIETINRLLSMGIKNYQIASSCQLIISQRLVRKLCSFCKIEQTFSDIEKHNLSQLGINFNQVIYKPQGCHLCHQGYLGRIGIFEVLVISKEIKKMIDEKNKMHLIFNQAKKEGFIELKEDAIDKINQGITSIEEYFLHS